MLRPDQYTRIRVRSVSQFLNFESKLPLEYDRKKWVFRGIASTKYALETTLERALKQYGESLAIAPERERQLMVEFQRRYHHHTSDRISPHDNIEWLALMQHYGAPTRLLDWTYSFFVAAYFALENANPRNEVRAAPCAVWALNTEVLDPWRFINHDILAKLESKIAEYFKMNPQLIHGDRVAIMLTLIATHVFSNNIDMVLAVNPFRLNERLTVQQGLFLAPGNLTRTFEENYIACNLPPNALIRFELDSSAALRREFLERLHKMNISNASLFPGLEGLSRSLWTRLSFPESLRPQSYRDAVHKDAE